MNKNSIILITLSILFLTACQKDDIGEIDPNQYPEIPTNGSLTEKYLDSLYIYSKEIWLWNKYLPNYDKSHIRKYAQETTPQAYQSALLGFLGGIVNPQTGLPFEQKVNGHLKYSYLSNVAQYGQRAELYAQGYGNGNGLDIGELSPGDIRVAYVNPGSSADSEGIKRGDRLLRINGIVVTNLNSAKEKLNQSNTTLTLQRADGSQYQADIYKEVYNSNAIYKDKIIDISGTKIGYLAYARFSNTTDTQNKLNTIFSQFAQENIETLVIDLRYNNGGFISATRYLANLIAPTSLNGKKMYSEHYNELMQQHKATILKTQPYYDAQGNPVYINGRRATYMDVDFSVENNTYSFEKSGNLLNVKQVYFIVSHNTASASEMIINILKPYLNVKIVGTQTYGKPIGFFGLKFDQWTLYLSSFVIKNADDKADYFDGFTPDIFAIDDLAHDFGDTNENSLSKVIQDITSQSGRVRNIKSQKNPIFIKEIQGLIQDEYRLLESKK